MAFWTSRDKSESSFLQRFHRTGDSFKREAYDGEREKKKKLRELSNGSDVLDSEESGWAGGRGVIVVAKA